VVEPVGTILLRCPCCGEVGGYRCCGCVLASGWVGLRFRRRVGVQQVVTRNAQPTTHSASNTKHQGCVGSSAMRRRVAMGLVQSSRRNATVAGSAFGRRVWLLLVLRLGWLRWPLIFWRCGGTPPEQSLLRWRWRLGFRALGRAVVGVATEACEWRRRHANVWV
jgi:hypothetical protein